MIIDFSNLGGGGGGYVLPVATSEVLGGVKIGSGVTVDSAGTISVEAGGIDVVSSLPASGTDGQIVVLVQEHKTPYCKAFDKDGNVLNVGAAYNFGDEYQPITIKSDMPLTEKILQGAYLNTVFRIYGGKDGNGDFFYYYEKELFDTIESGYVTDAITSASTSLYDSITIEMVNDGQGGLEVTRTSGDNFFFEFYYNQDSSTTTSYKEYVWSDSAKPSVDIAISNNGFGIEISYDEIPTFTGSSFNVFTVLNAGSTTDVGLCYSGGGFYFRTESDNQQVTADGKVHSVWNTSYIMSDGYIKFISNNAAITFNEEGLWNNQINATGWATYGRNGFINTGRNSYADFPITINGNSVFGIDFSGIYAPTSLGSNGQYMRTNGNNVYWDNLVIPQEVNVADALPIFADDGSLTAVNSGFSPSETTAFISRNSTSSSDKNNFTDNDEIEWYSYGGSFIYFDPTGLTTTADTFLYRIAMRTNENGDWNTSNIAYINVWRKYNNGEFYYEWDCEFDYYDEQQQPLHISESGFVDSSGSISANTAYLPLWRWWDGTYGYKFHFEYINGSLAMWMRYSDVDRDNQEPDYTQGENYGVITYTCRNHTTAFYNGISTDSIDTDVYTFKGGVWYKLGKLDNQQV